MTCLLIWNKVRSVLIIKLFSKNIFKGDVAETIKKYCDLSKKVDSQKTSVLTLQEVDKFLDELTEITKEDEQYKAFSNLCEKANGEDLKMVRFISYNFLFQNLRVHISGYSIHQA